MPPLSWRRAFGVPVGSEWGVDLTTGTKIGAYELVGRRKYVLTTTGVD
jgi:hypothetical protein